MATVDIAKMDTVIMCEKLIHLERNMESLQAVLVLLVERDAYFPSNIRETPLNLVQLLIQKMVKVGVPLELIVRIMSDLVNGKIVIPTVMVRSYVFGFYSYSMFKSLRVLPNSYGLALRYLLKFSESY